ncbi:hypothetical protein [Streptomyces sp. NPDC056713]|uniref:hypothetical protein n=1 Tax=Streptomyces sp. NPDC056713 TaxID=3345921 RepID=UPI0036C3A1D2
MALLVGAVVGLALVIAAVNWLLAHWWVLVLLAAVAVLAGAGVLYQGSEEHPCQIVR